MANVICIVVYASAMFSVASQTELNKNYNAIEKTALFLACILIATPVAGPVGEFFKK